VTIEANLDGALPIWAPQLRALTAAVRARAPNLRLDRLRTDTGELYIYVTRARPPARVKYQNLTMLATGWKTVPRDNEMLTFILRVADGWRIFAVDGEPYRTVASVEEAAEFIGSLKGPIATGAPQ
jgi:hypothetical protein